MPLAKELTEAGVGRYSIARSPSILRFKEKLSDVACQNRRWKRTQKIHNLPGNSRRNGRTMGITNQDAEFLALLHQIPSKEQGSWFERWISSEIVESETQRGIMIERIAVEAMIYRKIDNQINLDL